MMANAARILAAVLLAWAGSAGAQSAVSHPSIGSVSTIPGCTIGAGDNQLSPTGDCPGLLSDMMLARVSDSASKGDCTTGGGDGTTPTLCMWAAEADGGNGEWQPVSETGAAALGANLTAIQGLTTAADQMTYWTGSGAAAQAPLTSFARTIMDDTDASSVRSTIGAGTGSGDMLISSYGGSGAGIVAEADNALGIEDGLVVDADVNASAAIASTKIGYTPTTASDYDDPDPTTAQGALDKLASVLTSLRAAWGGQQDVLVDLTNGINWVGIVPTTFTNPWEQLQSAVNPYLLDPTTPRVVRCVGRATADLSDLRAIRYHNGTSDVQASIDAGWVVAKASSIGVDGMPVIDGSISGTTGKMLTFFSDGCRIEQAMTGQTRQAVLVYNGGAYFGGRPTAGGLESHVSDVIDYHGSFTITRTDIVGSWLQGRPIVMDSTAMFTSPTTTVSWMDDGVLRGSTPNFSLKLFGVPGVDDDDVGLVSIDTWGRFRSGLRIIDNGVGVLSYSNTRGAISESYIAGNGTNVQVGDPVNGCGRQFISTCGGDSCTNDTVEQWCANGAYTSGVILEGARTGSQLVAYGKLNRWSLTDVHFESQDTIATHQILLGAGVCDSGTRQYLSCGSHSECGSSGEQCDVATNTGIGQVSFRDITVPSARSETVFRGMYLGLGVGVTSFGVIRMDRLVASTTQPDGLLFGYDPAINVRVVTNGIRRATMPRRYPGYDEHPVHWCNWTFIADSAGDIQTGNSNCALDSTVLPLEVNCMTTANGAVINVEHRARSTANSAGTDLLATDLTCGASLATRTDGDDPGVASIFSAESVGGSRVLTPTITSETLAAGDALRIAVKYVRER